VEAFEAFVAVAMEAEGFVVSEAVKFPVKRRTAKAAYPEAQKHGFEVDLVGARVDRLVLATVKSFFGSRGVAADHVSGLAPKAADRKRYALLNDPEVRDTVISEACKRFGYSKRQVELRLYVGKFSAPIKRTHEPVIRKWCNQQRAGSGPIQVFGLPDIVGNVLLAASERQYRNNPVLVTMKVLEAAGVLNLTLPEGIGDDPD
jgi:hypothetical protein